MAEAKVFVNRPPSSNSPPNCAICLGSCANKCFSDSCMHEFCFKCLLQWSKIKAECPLCKQPFKRIIHNVRSNEEYEEHVVETQRNDDLINLLDNNIPDEFFIVPSTLHQLPTAHPHRHEFHVRTTFTVDSRGEQAVQHMLLTHPLMTGGRITIGANYHHHPPSGAPGSSRTVFPTRHRPRDFSATSFRRSIYAQNLWVNALPDFTGRYRDVTPYFFRNNPAARTRLVPWLNRELNALLYENTQLIMHLVDRIMETLLDHHICSRYFRNLLEEYLATKTNHFVHEFYSFMRSPFDMVGYDRNVIYTTRPQSPAPFLEDETVEVATSDDDSDVIIVGSSHPSQPVTISLVETDSDEPELVSHTDQLPMPILPPPQREDSPCGARPVSPVLPVQLPVVNLPPKLRHKRNKQIMADKEKHRDKKKRTRCLPLTSSSSSSTEGEKNDRSGDSLFRRRKRRKLRHKKQKKSNGLLLSMSTSSDTEVNVTSETDDEKPLIDVLKKKWKSRSERDKRKKSRSEPSTSKSKDHRTLNGESSSRTHGESSSRTNSRETLRAIINGESSRRTNGESHSRTNGESHSRTNGESHSRTNGESHSRTNGESSRQYHDIVDRKEIYHGESSRNNEQSHKNNEAQRDFAIAGNSFFAESSRSYGQSSKTHGESSRTYGESSRTNGESSRTYGESSRTYEESSRTNRESSRINEDLSRTNVESSKTSSNGDFSYVDEGSRVPFSYFTGGDDSQYLGGYRGMMMNGSEPMDLSVVDSLAIPGCSRSRSRDSTKSPPRDIAQMLQQYDTRVGQSFTPPINVSPLRSSNSSGSTTEECPPYVKNEVKNELKQEEQSNPSSSYKPHLVLKREKNNKWYVSADTDTCSD